MYLHATLQKSVSCQWIFTVGGGGGEDKNDYAPREDSSTAPAPAHPFRHEGQSAAA